MAPTAVHDQGDDLGAARTPVPADTKRELYSPSEISDLLHLNGASPGTWALSFTDPLTGSRLVVGTKAEPNFDTLHDESRHIFVWGGFRILTPEIIADPSFHHVGMAAKLADAMQRKLYYAKLLDVGGPLAREAMARGNVVGGKCVYLPGQDCKLGDVLDEHGLAFAARELSWLRAHSQLTCLTGQDINHGRLHTGERSLAFLNRHFPFSVDLSTAVPTAWGEMNLLRGIARAHELDLGASTVAMLGGGGIGQELVAELAAAGAAIHIFEPDTTKHDEIRRRHGGNGKLVFAGTKRELIATPAEYLLVNALAHSLDPLTVDGLAREQTGMRAVLGAENLMMPIGTEADSEARLLVRGIEYYPGSLVGIWGGLAALEKGLAVARGESFEEEAFRVHTKKFADIGSSVAHMLKDSPGISPRSAVERLYATRQSAT